MTKEEILCQVRFGETGSAGNIVLKNGKTANYGAIRLEDDVFVYYTGKGLREECWKNKDLTEENFVETGCIAKIPISEIEHIQ